MHPNPVYRDTPKAQSLDFARQRAFGTLILNGAEGPMIAHVPFLLAPDGTSADLHLVRSNPIARTLKSPQSAVIAASGPDGYVSPDWYGLADQVPTWNYVAVHLRGTLDLLPQPDLRALLDRQAAAFEERLLPKHPWTNDKMPAEALERMMRQIVPCRLTITGIDSTWKLNQNKPDAARLSAAAGIPSGFGQDLEGLAELMRAVAPR